MLNNTNSVNVHVKFGNLKYIMDWCRSNCRGDWHISNYTPDLFDEHFSSSDNTYEFKFSDDHDVTAFSLLWK